MYRRKLSSLPSDFTFPKTLGELGYFINDNDQIRMIDDPDLPFHYFASKNERFVQRQKYAWTTCISEIIAARLKESQLLTVRLPHNAAADEPHVPILVSANLAQARRVIVYLGDSQELGTLSGRMVTQEGINVGSVVNFARDAVLGPVRNDPSNDNGHGDDGTTKESARVPGDVAIVFANPGQLVWWRRGCRAVSFETWQALPRRSAAHEAAAMGEANRIARNGSAAEHMACLFEDVLAPLVAEKEGKRGVTIDVVAVNHAIDDLVDFLDGDWPRWRAAMAAVVCVASNAYSLGMADGDFARFWAARARFYILDREQVGTPLTGRQFVGCNVYSGGVADFTEHVVPRHYKSFLDYFKLVDRNQGYENTPQEIPGGQDDDVDKTPGWGHRSE